MLPLPWPAMSQATRLWIACSGGLDSVALAHHVAASPLKPRMGLWYIDHGLDHAALPQLIALAAAFECPLIVRSLALRGRPGNQEALARDHRYQAWASSLNQGELLLLGHHQDDQDETLLWRFFRGHHHLIPMPDTRPLGQGTLMRPWLTQGLRKHALHTWATHHHITWSEDPSNTNTRWTRNRLRHQVIPRLDRQRPAWRQLLHTLVALGQNTQDRLRQHLPPGPLSCAWLAQHTPQGQRALLRAWIGRHTPRQPPEGVLHALQAQNGAQGAQMHWQGMGVGCYRGAWHWVIPESIALKTPTWNTQQPLQLPDGQTLTWEKLCALGVLKHPQAHWTLHRPPWPVLPRYRGHRRTLKRWAQTFGIPPWERAQVALLCCDGQPIAVFWSGKHQLCDPSKVFST